MGDGATSWNGELVRSWLESRIQSARLDQTAADRQGYEARDDFDKAAAEEWACRILVSDPSVDEQAGLVARIRQLIAEDEYRVAGVNDNDRFERHVRSVLRKLARMVKANEGFANTRRYQ